MSNSFYFILWRSLKMSEKTLIVKPTEEVQAEAVAEQQVAEDSKIVNFFVGIGGSGVYRVSSNVEELNLRDHIEAIATIEINTLAALLEAPNAKESVELFLRMKKEILNQAVDFIVEQSAVEDKEAVKALFK
jgi:predicted flavoprotein YhiN